LDQGAKRNKGGAPVGNKNGVRGHVWRQAIIRALAHKASGSADDALFKLAQRLVNMASAGDMQALREIGDRMDGKPAQIVANDDGEAFRIETIRRLIVEPPKP
jgi:hypothetical protein